MARVSRMRRCPLQYEVLPAPAEREPAALTGSRLFGPVQPAGPRNSASAETMYGQSTPTKVQPYPIAYSCGRRPDGDHAIDWMTWATELILGYCTCTRRGVN